jgi:hypothetical protein
MKKLDPERIFDRLRRDIPAPLHGRVFVVGSLAAAYHFRTSLEGRAVNTKDADVVVHPAGNVASCRRIAERLFGDGWTRRDDSYPRAARAPAGELRALRLHPPRSEEYFVEFLGLPGRGQKTAKEWIPVRVGSDGHAGWYGLSCFRFMGLAAEGRLESRAGLAYAAPRMMALANLLSHPNVGADTMSAPIGGRTLLRSAKDLGRVLALARLTPPDELPDWTAFWVAALRKRFPKSWRALGRRAGSGLRALLDDPVAFEEAHHTTRIGLLSGLGVEEDQLRAVADQLFERTLHPLAEACR